MFNNNPDFYPTPKYIISKMLESIDFRLINTVLEPSAGKGDIAESITDKLRYSHNNYNNKEVKYDIDTIEIDENLQYILQGKKFRTVHNDFLTYNSYKKYDLIVMNPPFSEGDKHLLKAIEMQEKGGLIVCLLNAETLKNPYSNTRKDLVNKLEQYNAEIQYIDNAFMDAERKTGVEVALIKINILKPENESIILDELRKQEQHKTESKYNNYNLINADFIKGIVEQYNFEVKAGLKLIEEYNALKPLLLNSIKKDNYTSDILVLVLSGNDRNNNNCTIENGYIKKVRAKYWQALFTSQQFIDLFTTNLREKYMNKISELVDYDFSLYNIYSIKLQLNNELIKGVEETILNLFQEFSVKHYYDETAKNIHYYNGWKTNKAWKINKKVIIPLMGYRDLEYSWGRFEPTNYKVINKLTDIEKVFNYLDGGLTEELNLKEALQFAEGYGDTKKIDTKYFLLTFYKKGTCHIEFKNEELLHKFNLFGSQRLGWLPPSYGKTKYNDMSKEEKTIIDEFEGKESYNKVMNNKNYYIVESSKLLLPA
jgi:hypothetical protein